MNRNEDCTAKPATGDVTLAVLAGGVGSRMGQAKALLRIGGRPILEHLLDRLKWPGPTLLVTAPGRENPPGYQGFSKEAVDPIAGVGPLRGLLTAVENSPTERLVVVTVDMPDVEPAQLQWLIDRLAEYSEQAGVMLRRRDGDDTWIEPFPLACRRTAADIIRGRLAADRLSVRDLTVNGHFACVATPATWAGAWTNLNEPRDFARYLNRPTP
jgi:molybdopterin-guanine dinucleotide biosynthesis protein A